MPDPDAILPACRAAGARWLPTSVARNGVSPFLDLDRAAPCWLRSPGLPEAAAAGAASRQREDATRG